MSLNSVYYQFPENKIIIKRKNYGETKVIYLDVPESFNKFKIITTKVNGTWHLFTSYADMSTFDEFVGYIYCNMLVVDNVELKNRRCFVLEYQHMLYTIMSGESKAFIRKYTVDEKMYPLFSETIKYWSKINPKHFAFNLIEVGNVNKLSKAKRELLLFKNALNNVFKNSQKQYHIIERLLGHSDGCNFIQNSLLSLKKQVSKKTIIQRSYHDNRIVKNIIKPGKINFGVEIEFNYCRNPFSKCSKSFIAKFNDFCSFETDGSVVQGGEIITKTITKGDDLFIKKILKVLNNNKASLSGCGTHFHVSKDGINIDKTLKKLFCDFVLNQQEWEKHCNRKLGRYVQPAYFTGSKIVFDNHYCIFRNCGDNIEFRLPKLKSFSWDSYVKLRDFVLKKFKQNIVLD